MVDKTDQTYGLSTNLFVSRKANGESLVVGGIGENQSRWARVLSQRAAQTLWYHLTRCLFPEKSEMVTALVSTSPLRADNMPTITTHVSVEQRLDGGYDLVGMVGDQTWWVQLTDFEARRFWTALDIALYPVGWQGRRSTRTKQ
ncbi:MAG: hypothetical protein CL610_05845 [Anaerolineaceae bacterium]|nr:hypothetical protein [Anaerolineaceae bacterium]